MRVRTLLENKGKEVVTTTPTTSISDAMAILIERRISCLPVVDSHQKLVGIVSDKDIFRKVHETSGKYHHLTVADLMTTDLIVGVPDDDLAYIAGIMDKNWVRHIPIVEGDTMVGLVSQRDVVRVHADHRELENRYLRLYLDGLSTRDMSGD